MAIVTLNGDSLPSHTSIGEDITALSIEVGQTWRQGTGYAFSFDGQSTSRTYQDAGGANNDDPTTTSNVATTLCSRINSAYSSILEATVLGSTVTVLAKSGNTLDVSFDIESNEGGYGALLTFDTDLDVISPTISSFSPADNATAVATTSNIILNFSEAVDVETGNIVIYKASDDSIVETIDVTSISQVTGTGSTQITINPSSDLAEQTEYYVQIAATAFDDSADNSYLGISDKTSLSFATADETAPIINGLSGSAGASTSTTSVDENVTTVGTFTTTNETVTWSLNGGADALLFSINSSSGALSFSSAPDYESPRDSNSGNDYVVVVRAKDSAGNTSDQTVTVSVLDKDDTAPTITGPSSSEAGASTSAVSMSENGTAVNTFGANESVTWSISGGADSSLFTINSVGTLSFSSAPDYETPGDSDTGNDYVVVVRATDSGSNTSDQTVTVSITNVSETTLLVSSHQAGQSYILENIKDYDGNLHANPDTVSDSVKSAYKYQGKLDINNDGVLDAIYTNKQSGRWVAGKIDSVTGHIDYSDHGAGGGTRVVGIYDDPLITVGNKNGGFLHDGVTPAPAQFGATGSDRYLVVNGEIIDRLALNSQVRFQNDLLNDNLTVKTSGDYDGDGLQEVYWKTNDGDVYLRSLMHADGNIQYANYQNQTQMSYYLSINGYDSVISLIV